MTAERGPGRERPRTRSMMKAVGSLLVAAAALRWACGGGGGGGGPELLAVAPGAVGFVTVGEGGRIFSSSNASSWTSRDSGGVSSTLRGVTSGANGFVAVGDGGV